MEVTRPRFDLRTLYAYLLAWIVASVVALVAAIVRLVDAKIAGDDSANDRAEEAHQADQQIRRAIARTINKADAQIEHLHNTATGLHIKLADLRAILWSHDQADSIVQQLRSHLPGTHPTTNADADHGILE